MSSNVEVMVGQAGANLVRIDYYPGELKTPDGVTRGFFYIFVRDQFQKRYEACGGPPPEDAHASRGGRFAGETREGTYTLGPAVHHVSSNWPASTVPWGAKLRRRADQEIEFSTDGRAWIAATGPKGVTTLTWILFEERTRLGEAKRQNEANKGTPGYKPVAPPPVTPAERDSINLQARNFFLDENGELLASYDKNDFGEWAWNMMYWYAPEKRLKRSDLFVHTTPRDEAMTKANQPFELTPSHGCVHIRPRDRDEMMLLGYLQKGVKMVVKKYGLKGPA